MAKGIFIVIEGSDGSGKSTQFNLLKEYLEEKGREVKTYKFPQYDSPSGYFVTSYLNGKYGSADSLGAYTPSLFYALDRFEASSKIRKDLEDGKVVLCDRYVGSNMAHQGQKIDDTKKRHEYFEWVHNLEFSMIGIPKPDLSIVLLMPAHIAQELTAQRTDQRDYTTLQQDIHEADLNHLKRAVATYEEMCEMFPDSFTPLRGVVDDKLKSIQEVHGELVKILQPLLK